MSIFIPSVDGVVSGAKSYVWSTAELVWQPMTQPGGSGGGGGDASATNQSTEIARLTSILAQLQPVQLSYGGELSQVFSTAATLTVFPSGPTKKLRIYYASYSPTTAPVALYFSFGAFGSSILLNNIVVAGSIIAKDFGQQRYIEGGLGEGFYLGSNADVEVYWNVFYTEV